MTEQQEEMPSYDDYNENAGEAFIIPAKSEDLKPETCKILKIEKRKKAAGGFFPVMILEKEDQSKIQVPAWTRDVASLCKQWGTDPKAWLDQNVRFSIKNKKMILDPMPITKEEVIA